jgi:hypothetical protein
MELGRDSDTGGQVFMCLPNFHVCVLDDFISVPNYYIPGRLCLFFILLVAI